jgi:hypothetical protein
MKERMAGNSLIDGLIEILSAGFPDAYAFHYARCRSESDIPGRLFPVLDTLPISNVGGDGMRGAVLADSAHAGSRRVLKLFL